MTTDLATSLEAQGQIFEFLFQNRNAERSGLLDRSGLIPGYDTIAKPGEQTFGSPRRPHLVCLIGLQSSTQLSSPLTFKHGPMSVIEIVDALYQALRIQPLDQEMRDEVDTLLLEPQSDRRDFKILEIYRSATAEDAIRTLILAGPCDLAEYIVALRRTDSETAQLLTARDLRALVGRKLPDWCIRKQRFGKRLIVREGGELRGKGLTRCYVPPLYAAALLAELTHAAQNTIAHAWRALSASQRWLTRRMLQDELGRNRDLSENAKGFALAVGMGMEPLLPDERERTDGNHHKAAKIAVVKQLERIEQLGDGTLPIDDFIEGSAVGIIDFPVVDAGPALAKTLPQSEAVRAWGLTVRQHIEWALAWLYDDARLACEEANHSPSYPKQTRAIAKMTHGQAMWFLATQWLANVGDDVATLFDEPARIAASLHNDDERIERKDPVDSENFHNRGKTMLDNGRLARTSDVIAGTAFADARYDFRFWLKPETELHNALKMSAKPMLPNGFGNGFADRIGNLPANISIKQHGKRAGQRTQYRSAAGRQALDIHYAAAHDAMLMPFGPSLSSMHLVLRSYSQRLYQAEFRELFKKTPGNFNPANHVNRVACLPYASSKITSHLFCTTSTTAAALAVNAMPCSSNGAGDHDNRTGENDL